MKKPRSSSIIVLVLATVAIPPVSNDATGSTAPAEALPFGGPPAPAALPQEWKGARLVYMEDFEHGADDAFPGRWRLRISQWPEKDRPSDFLRIRRLQDSARALQVRGLDGGEGGLDFDLTWDPKIVGGLLRVGFDVRATHGEKARMRLGVADVREQAAPGMGESQEMGPSLWVQWPGGAWSVRNSKRQYVPLPVEKLEADRWYRMAVVADLGRNQFDLFVDGARAAADVPFADFLWFKGADRLSFQATHLMLDNISLHHLPRTGKAKPKSARLPPPRIPARYLKEAPVLDGKLNDAPWKDAHHTEEFFTLRGEPSAQPRTETWLGYDDKYLHIATRVWPRDMKTARGRAARKQTGEFWGIMEVFIDVSGADVAGKYIHLSYDEGGNKSQELGHGHPWHGQWDVAAHLAEDHWTAELRVPIAELAAVHPPAETWGINVCRGTNLEPGADNAVLSPTFGGFHTPRRFARMTGLDPDILSPLRCALRLAEPVFTGNVPTRVTLIQGRRDMGAGRFQLEVTAYGQDGPVVQQRQTVKWPAGKREQAVTVELPVTMSGDYFFQAKVSRAGRALPLAISPRIFARVVPLGVLQARTDLNYYTHEATARIRGTLVGKAVPPGSRAVLQVRRAAPKGRTGGTKPPRQALLERSADVAGSPFVVELPLRRLPIGELELKLSLLGADNTRLAESTVPLLRRPAKHNEVKIRWDNVMIVNGRPFFPVFIWNSDPPIAHYLGANTLLCTAAYLHKYKLWEECRRFGIYLIARDWQFPYISEVLDQFETDPSSFIGTYQDQPTLLAYFVEDEPRTTKDGKAAPHIIRTANAIRAMDPYHPTFISEEIGWTRAFAYSPIVEVIGQHIYPSSGRYRERSVAEQTAMMVRTTRGQKPIWQTMQGFHYKTSREHPTPLEFRHAAYSALVHGATGLGLWGMHHREGFPEEDIRGLTSDKALFAQARKTFHAVRRLSPVLTSDEPVDAPATIDNDRIAIRTRRWRGQQFVWLVNMTRDEQTATLVLPTDRGRLTNQIEPGGEWPIERGRCELKLGPLQPMVLK